MDGGGATLLLTTTAALASRNVPVDPELLCSHSGIVAEGDVVSIDWEHPLLPLEPGGPSMVATTRVKIDTTTVIKGTVTGGRVVVRLPGGVNAGGNWQLWDGVPHFEVGDRVLIHGTEEGTPALLNLTTFSNAALFRRGTAPDTRADDGDQRRVGSWSTGSRPEMWTPLFTQPDDSDADEDTGGGDLHDSLDNIVEVTTSPYLTWSGLVTAATSVCSAIVSHEEPAQTIDHTGW